MPEKAAVYSKSSDKGLLVFSGIVAAAGIGLIVLGLKGGGSSEPGVGGLKPGESFSDFQWDALGMLDAQNKFPIQIGSGEIIRLGAPTALYVGPGRNMFAYARVMQNQPGHGYVTVYGSGIAGSNLPATPSPTQYHLVPTTQVEPVCCPAQALCLGAWPGPPNADCSGHDPSNPICGGPPIAGYGDLFIQIYGDEQPVDGGGYASPSCNPTRLALAQVKYPGLVHFFT